MTPGPASPVGPLGRAYTGALHGSTWQFPVGSPPATLEVVHRGVRQRYRLVCGPRGGRPVRDHQGRFVYVPDITAGRHAAAAISAASFPVGGSCPPAVEDGPR